MCHVRSGGLADLSVLVQRCDISDDPVEVDGRVIWDFAVQPIVYFGDVVFWGFSVFFLSLGVFPLSGVRLSFGTRSGMPKPYFQ
jgi:hypothetical protein